MKAATNSRIPQSRPALLVRRPNPKDQKMSKVTVSPELREVMKPQAFPELPGCTFHFSFRDVGDLESATSLAGCTSLIAALLRAETRVVEEAAARGVKNPDGSRYSGDIDGIPLSIIELSRRLADALHRRAWGAPLVLEGEGQGEAA